VSLIAKDKGGGDFKPVPAGTHIAVCTMVADMGVQPTKKFKPRPQLYIRWELPNEVTSWKDGDGKDHSGPMVIGQKYTMSLSEKANLRADLESWRGRLFTEAELAGFDIKNILGKSCMLGVTHNTVGAKTYANISAVMGLPKGQTPVPPSVIPIAYDIDQHDEATFRKLPNWLQEAIQARVMTDTKSSAAAGPQNPDDLDDDIPF
jgi:hypothetical protein